MKIIIALLLVLSGCVTITKNYYPVSKKDTVYKEIKCERLHIELTPNYNLRYEKPHWRDIDSLIFSTNGKFKLDTSLYLSDTLKTKKYD